MSISTLVFPEAIDSFQVNRADIRSGLRDTYNRLQSISEDADFVATVQTAFPDLPVVANQRAGAWYVKPDIAEDIRAYFKSTDGHIGVHDYNVRRSNLSLVPLILQRNGIILVDSTRRGKRFPDALSKTIPIWCAVLNRVRVTVAPPSTPNEVATWEENGKLWTLPSAVGRSEHSQIEVKIEEWAKRLLDSSYDLSAVKSLPKPLRPIFISPASTLTESSTSSAFPNFIPVILVSASKLPADLSSEELERTRGYAYVQGSGDDHEAWSNGLTPTVFWENHLEITSAARGDIDRVIANLLAAQPSLVLPSSDSASKPIEVRSTGVRISFGTFSFPLPLSTSDSSFRISISFAATSNPDLSPSNVALSTRPGKGGYPAFFSSLDEPLLRSEKFLRAEKGVEILVQESGSEANDLGVAVALILFARHFDSEGKFILNESDRTERISKSVIRSCLQWILETFPSVNPSRSVLNRVNEYLLSGANSRRKPSDNIMNSKPS